MGKGKKPKKKGGPGLKMKKDEAKTNPFEMKLHREKHNVLGRKMKHERGLPGVARTKAIKKRKETLLKEYLSKHKSNCFIDRRIGEYAPNMSKEDKNAARFVHERKRSHSVFNLNEEEKLTHLGKSILELNTYDDPRSDSDEELDPEFIKEAHFGGFLTKKNNENDNMHKSHKEYMDDLIAETKQKKHTKQVEKEANTILTEKLDEEWKTVQTLLTKVKKDDTSTENKPDHYDLTVRQLQFEARGKAVDRLKTCEELAKEEKEKLEKLEDDRLQRMTGLTQEKLTVSNHLSADDLYDGLQLDINEGNKNITTESSDRVDNRNQEDDKESSDSSQEEDDVEDTYSDLHTDEESSSETQVTLLAKNIQSKQFSNIPINSLPFVYNVPSDFELFLELVSVHTVEEQGIIVDRMIKCNHPSLGEGNCIKMEKLFVFILQYIHDICEDVGLNLNLINVLVPHLYTLSQFSPLKTAESFREVIMEKYESFQQLCVKRRIGAVECPGLSTLIFFKLCCILYPTSDFSHPVVTPSMLFMSQILTHCNFNSLQSILKGLFVCNLFLEYIAYSRRFVPEAINFLTYVMYLATGKDHKQTKFHVLKSSGNIGLFVQADTECAPTLFQLNWLRAIPEKDLNELKILIVQSDICLLHEFAVMYENLPSWKEMFSSVKELCSECATNNYPQSVTSRIKKLVGILDKEIPFAYLIQERRRPQPLKLLEPRFADKFDGKKRLGGNKEKIKQTLLVRKHKRELKGAVREIRQDNYFLANEILAEKMAMDAERKRKVKELYRDLAEQEGEFKALQKKKNKL